MTTYYVGIGGNDGNNGTSWATRKLTLNGAEDIPVAAGDTVYVGAGTYRETLTADVSGTSGNLISYIGDYTGEYTDGVGGIVRVTGSDDDETATRDWCIQADGKDYRLFRGFLLDGCGDEPIDTDNCDYWTVDQCVTIPAGDDEAMYFKNATNITVSNCLSRGQMDANALIWFRGDDVINDSGCVVSNFIALGTGNGVQSTKVDGVTIKNSTFIGTQTGVKAVTLDTGTSIAVNNCLFINNNLALSASVAGEIVEDYNLFFSNETDRTNVNTGANSEAIMANLDHRWFFEMVYGGRLLTPFDLASYSQIINVAGTSPTTSDMRGTTVQGAQREWGALEYDSTLFDKWVNRGMMGCG